RTNVPDEMLILDGRVSCRIIVALVKEQVLLLLGLRWSLDNDRFDCLAEQFRVVHIRPRDDNAEWTAACVDDEAAFDAFFAPIRWVFPDPVPPVARLAHRATGRLPFPLDSMEGITFLDEDPPDFIQNSLLLPALEGTMNGTVVAKLPRQVVP